LIPIFIHDVFDVDSMDIDPTHRYLDIGQLSRDVLSHFEEILDPTWATTMCCLGADIKQVVVWGQDVGVPLRDLVHESVKFNSISVERLEGLLQPWRVHQACRCSRST
jgi:hypothetical protein